VHATAPAVLNMPIQDEAATFKTSFPWIVRGGLRFIYMKGTHEAGDFEVDGTWEGWGHIDDPQVNIPNLSVFTDIHPAIVHKYKDTFSLRAGGAINTRLPVGVLSFRLGVFYDSSATENRDTRLDFDTLAKIGLTGGLGYKVRGFQINLAYAYLIEASREVTDGEIAPINGASHGDSVDSKGNPLPAVNNGIYTARTQIFSLGMTLAWDELVKTQRVVRYHAEYEPGGEPEPTPARPVVPPAEPEEPAQSQAEEKPEPTMQISPDEVASLEAEQPTRKKSKPSKKKKKRGQRRADRRRHATG
jgi:hypothetical protein